MKVVTVTLFYALRIVHNGRLPMSEAATQQKSQLLRVLPVEAPLRGQSPFLTPSSWTGDTRSAEQEQPRALRGLARIIEGGLCHRCGSCVGICPTATLGVDPEGYPRVANLTACTDCDLCVKVCPGDEFNFQQAHQTTFGVAGDNEDTHGHFLSAIIAHDADPDLRERSTSGGLVTSMLLALLESGEIDGAVTIVSDEHTHWKGKPIIARTREQLLASMKSKYAIAPTNSVFAEILATPGRYALVGLPCQIHGFVKAAELDKRLRERVVLTIALFCHAAIEHRAFEVIWETLGADKAKVTKFISRIGKHPGTPYVQLNDGRMLPVYFPYKTGYRPTSIEMINILYRLYTPSRCLTCFDASGEFADISVGDPWMAPPEDHVDFYKGWSFALIRSARAQSLVSRLVEEKRIVSLEVTRKEALACNTLMAHEKRWRAFRVIETLRRQGKPIPTYHMPTPRHSLKHFIKIELHMLSHIFCFLPRYRDSVLRFILSQGGYFLLWCNYQRRCLRFWIRDTKAACKRRLFGRK